MTVAVDTVAGTAARAPRLSAAAIEPAIAVRRGPDNTLIMGCEFLPRWSMRTVTAHRALTVCTGTVHPSAVPGSGLVDASQPEAGCTPCDISGHTRHLSRGGGYGVISHRRTRVVIEVDGKQHCAQAMPPFRGSAPR